MKKVTLKELKAMLAELREAAASILEGIDDLNLRNVLEQIAEQYKCDALEIDENIKPDAYRTGFGFASRRSESEKAGRGLLSQLGEKIINTAQRFLGDTVSLEENVVSRKFPYGQAIGAKKIRMRRKC